MQVRRGVLQDAPGLALVVGGLELGQLLPAAGRAWRALCCGWLRG